MKMTTAALMLAALLMPIDAAAQKDISSSFDELSRAGRLKQGDTVWVLWELKGIRQVGEMKATVVDLTEATIGVLAESPPPGGADLATSPAEGGHIIVLPEDRVMRIDAEVSDSFTNGAVIGAVVGFSSVAVPSLLALAACESYCFGPGGAALAAGLGAAGIGAVIGVGLDAAAKSRGVVYAAPDLSGARVAVSVSPIISRERKGFLFTLSW